MNCVNSRLSLLFPLFNDKMEIDAQYCRAVWSNTVKEVVYKYYLCAL